MSEFTKYWELYSRVQGEATAISAEIPKGNIEVLKAKLELIQQLHEEFLIEARRIDPLDADPGVKPSRDSVNDWVTKLTRLLQDALERREEALQASGGQGEQGSTDADQAGPSQGAADQEGNQGEKTLVPVDPGVTSDTDSEESEFLGFAGPVQADQLQTSNFLQNLIDEMDKEKHTRQEKQGVPKRPQEVSAHTTTTTKVEKVKAHESVAKEGGPSQRPPMAIPVAPPISNNPFIPHPMPREQNHGYTQPVYAEVANSHSTNSHYLSPNPQPYYPPQFKMQVENVIKIPHFDGRRLDQWVPFRAAFLRYIHENPTLDNLSKLSQLLQHVSGEALETINGFPFQESQYASAWLVLNKRYNREDHIIDNTISRLMNLPILRGNVSTERLSTILNVTNQMLRTLPTFGIEVSSWDPILKYILISKFDEETRSDWKIHVGTRERVPLGTLLDFLEVRMFTVGNYLQGGHQPRGQAGQQPRGQGGQQPRGQGGQQPRQARPQGIYMVNERAEGQGHQDGRCLKCGGDHFLYKCPALVKLLAKERTVEIRRLNLCFKCLRKHSGSKTECYFGNCPVCQGPHNTFLCYTKEKRDRDARQQEGRQESTSSTPNHSNRSNINHN